MWPAVPPAAEPPRWSRAGRFWFLALPILTAGLAAWVPPLWAARRVRDSQRRARLYLAAAGLAVLAVLALVLSGTAPQDSTGSPTGAGSEVGALLAVLAAAGGTWVAVRHRAEVFPASARPDRPAVGRQPGWLAPGSQALLPGVAQAQARRNLRAQYRALAADDPGLAHEMQLGRPDRGRTYDDGGLLDLNALDAAALSQYAGLTAGEAASVVATREKLGRLSSVEELVVHGELTLATADRLRDVALFLP